MVECNIDTSVFRPISQTPYNTPVTLRDGVDAEIDWLREKQYTHPSDSLWSSPIVAVRKPNGKIRLCVDYKKLNVHTLPEPFYMPRVEEVVESVGRACVISRLDLAKGYYQVPMAPASIPATAFTCHRGRFEFLRMPFGLKNAPATFQTLMTKIIDSCKGFASPYMDDIVVYSDNWERHMGHVRRVLDCLKEAGLTANPRKCA